MIKKGWYEAKKYERPFKAFFDGKDWWFEIEAFFLTDAGSNLNGTEIQYLGEKIKQEPTLFHTHGFNYQVSEATC